MIPLNVNFYASLRKISGTKSVGFSLEDGSTVQKLLDTVIARYPEMHSKLYEQDGKLSRRAHIVVNGRFSHLIEQGLDTKISPTDTVDVFPIGHF